MNNFVKISVKRPVTTTMFLLIAILLGLLSFTTIKLDMLPNMDIPVAIVSTSYDGASSEQVEKLVTEPLEGVLGTVPGISDITSVSSYGNSMVVLVFETGTDIDFATLDMREKIDMVSNFLPDGASKPTVFKIDISQMNNIMVGVTSETKDLVQLQNIVEDKIVGSLERQDGVARVTHSGGQEAEVLINLNKDAMLQHGISEQTVMQMVMASNTTTPVGSVQQGDKNLSITVSGNFTSIEDIENIIIPTQTGMIHLYDIADVNINYRNNGSTNYINGQPSMVLTIQKQSTANSVEVSDEVTKEIENLNKELTDVELVMIMDPALFINMAISNVGSAAVIGGLLAILILYIFLGDIRATLIVGVAIPTSIITTFLFMDLQGLTLNMMSLGGLTLGIGMLVDNSIVVIENIYRKIEEGYERDIAAIEGTSEVILPIIASTLTTIAVFLPILFSGGVTAEMFGELSFTIAFSLISSLLVAISFVPMAASLFLETTEQKIQNKHTPNKFQAKFNEIFKKVENRYTSLLKKSLEKRKTVYLTVLAFIIVTGAVFPNIEKVLVPEMDEGIVMVSITLPKGTVVEKTEEKMKETYNNIKDIDGIDSIVIMTANSSDGISSGSSNRGSMYVVLEPESDRSSSSFEIAEQINDLTRDITGCDIKAVASSASMGAMGEQVVTIQLFGNNLETLNTMANDITIMAQEIDGVGNISSTIEDVTPQAEIYINEEKATLLGVSSQQVATTLKTYLSGTVVSAFKTDDASLDIRVQFDNDFDYINEIENILIPTSFGTAIPLTDIAEIEVVNIPAKIDRENQQRTISINISAGDSSMGVIAKEMEQKMDNYILPEGYSWKFAGATEDMQEIFFNMTLALVSAVLLVYMIMAAQFESYVYPFIVMFSIPIALTAGIFGLFIFNEAFSITSFMGLIMLSGIVINNAIVLIDYTNLLLREQNLPLDEALITAGRVRLRPILISSLTTALGLLPALLSPSSGAAMLKGLSAVVIFGLMASTLVTLVLIPTVYKSVNLRKEKKKAKKLKAKV